MVIERSFILFILFTSFSVSISPLLLKHNNMKVPVVIEKMTKKAAEIVTKHEHVTTR